MASCATNQLPNFERLYNPPELQTRRVVADETAARPPLIVVPGLLGTRLRDAESGREVWPGSLGKLLLSDYAELALPFDPISLEVRPSTLVPGGITETAVGRDFYGQLLRTLVEHGGYELGDPDQDLDRTAHTKPHVYVFSYDWRQDNVRTVQAFAEFVERIRTAHGEPELKFDVVAHSMGGLMMRYFLRYGTEDVLDDNTLKVTWAGAPAINKLILLGTPNLGSVSAIEGFYLGQKVGLSRMPQEVVVTMPSTYQLFPHRIVDWLYTSDGRVVDVDQFDRDAWQRRGWGVFAPKVQQRVRDQHGDAYADALARFFAKHAERARRFSWSLTVCPNYDEALQGCPPEIPEPPVRLVVFGGNCHNTRARLVLEGDALRFQPRAIANKSPDFDYSRLMFDPGDGTVTKPSLLARDALSPNTPRHEFSYFPLAYAFMLCEGHATLTGNVHFEDNLLDVLLTRALPWQLHLDHAHSRRED